MQKLREECGVFGVYAGAPQCDTNLASTCYYGLFSLQHRGQESCGIVLNDDGVFHAYKDNGLVEQVFTPEVLAYLGQGRIAVGHCRYGTAGSEDRVNAQPLVINHVKGSMALAMNGNLTNALELREELELTGAIFHTNSNCEVIAHLITAERIKSSSIEEAVNRTMDRLEGAYSLVVMSPTKLIAARDPHGFHPLCYGQREDGAYVVASESCALQAVGAEFVADIKPGQIVIFDKDGIRTIDTHCGVVERSTCVFEYIYFARPDSVIDGSSVHNARVRAGAMLALEHPVQADVVVGAPDSGLDAAIGYARQSGIPYGIGLIKNKYIGRTFIAPGQKSREDKVRIKLSPVKATIEGKRVVLVDDSIVRGTTLNKVVKMLRNAGAKEVHVRVAAPPFLYPCYYGTDISSSGVLVAHNRTTEEICEIIGADSLGYMTIKDVVHIAENGGGCGYCTACFDGKYPTKVPVCNRKHRSEQKISEKEERHE